MFPSCVVPIGVKTSASFVKALPNSHALTVEGEVSPVGLHLLPLVPFTAAPR